MSRYNICKSLVTLAELYGNDMRLHGSSMYWNSPKQYEDTTNELYQCELFKKLGMYDRSMLLTYGQQMKQYGMGCYAERGAAAQLYDKYSKDGGVPNPFANAEQEKEVKLKESEPGME